MSTRRQWLTITAGSAAVVALRRFARRRRERLADATKGFVDTIAPLEVSGTSIFVPTVDEAHAPGHRHLGHEHGVLGRARSQRVRNRPFSKHQRGMRHPGRA